MPESRERDASKLLLIEGDRAPANGKFKSTRFNEGLDIVEVERSPLESDELRPSNVVADYGREIEEEDEEEKSRCTFDNLRKIPRHAIDWLKAPMVTGSDEDTDSSDGDVSSEEGEAVNLLEQRMRRTTRWEEHVRRKTIAHDQKMAMKTEEQKTNRLQYLVTTNGFELAACIAILLAGFQLGVETNCDYMEHCEDFHRIAMQITVIALFTIEWSLRVKAGGWSFFHSREHRIDTFVVWSTNLASITSIWTQNEASLAVILHIMKLLRLVRMFEIMKQFQAFRTLVGGILGTQRTLIACIVLLACAVFLFAVIGIEILGRGERSPHLDEDKRYYFQNGVTWAMLEMTRFMTFDNAAEHLRDFVTTDPHCLGFFLIFSAVSAYVILNLITGVIVGKALEIARENEGELAREKRRHFKQQLKDLKRAFVLLDADGTGEVDEAEFDAAFEDKGLETKLTSIGFSRGELKELFKILDADGAGALDIKEFCSGMSKMMGDASAKDMLLANKHIERTLKLLRIYFFSTAVERQSIHANEEVTRFYGPIESALTDVELSLRDRMVNVEEKLRILRNSARTMMSNLEILKQHASKIRSANEIWVSQVRAAEHSPPPTPSSTRTKFVATDDRIQPDTANGLAPSLLPPKPPLPNIGSNVSAQVPPPKVSRARPKNRKPALDINNGLGTDDGTAAVSQGSKVYQNGANPEASTVGKRTKKPPPRVQQ